MQVTGGRLEARCGLSRGREDYGRGVGMGLGLRLCARRGCGCKYGGAGWVRAMGSLGAERTVGGGLRFVRIACMFM